ncbi:D-glycero-beta-D-manno-heptose 1,7-bisphosphate 7-phosphatase [Catenovulum maritimum]|uniref:D,D-heptose 1,7-bisphosphate phosphatase n=1 Tax=Catenovulum maritimum TaxID=1513271 RepID=A0A0J8GY29_9ALTE|nr:D-glycero-beta-D-manno-heptose 1,7-bisphosphate 7-phosphatase [Catenovulum maritimum]KMT65633.1 D,D-heptose 1,7-bisphosphate phosphatase [Catenovulum maritimum]
MAKALFLDRDGIINLDHGYVYQAESFEFMPGIFELCQNANGAGYQIIIVTNQSGIARGYYSEEQVNQLHDWMIEQFKSHKVDISKVYFCPHHPEHGGLQYQHNCLCRKPNPGMLLRANRELGVDLSQSIMLGDKESDVQAALKAGIPHRILLNSDYINTADLKHTAATQVVSQLSEIDIAK